MDSKSSNQNKNTQFNNITEGIRYELFGELINAGNANIDENYIKKYYYNETNRDTLNQMRDKLISIIKNRLIVLASRATGKDNKIPLLVSTEISSATIISNSKRLGLQKDKNTKNYSLLNDIDQKLLDNNFIDDALKRTDARLKKYLSTKWKTKLSNINTSILTQASKGSLFVETS